MICPTCNQEIPDGSTFCFSCGAQITAPQLPEKASSRSLTALVLGIVGIAACGCCGPFALIIGWMELNKIKLGLSSPASKTYALVGMILGIITTILSLIIIPLILAAIAIPNFFAAQTRSKVSRVHGELLMCATALEAYYIDNNAYPLPEFDNQHQPILPNILTTPIAYITRIPFDPFASNGKQRYLYFPVDIASGDTTNAYWILTSQGPDQKVDIDITRYNPQDPIWMESNNAPATYDPTNGTTSPGDIWRRGP
ncbi:MAG: zinc-ribbon domain-containing protein [bacterium]